MIGPTDKPRKNAELVTEEENLDRSPVQFPEEGLNKYGYFILNRETRNFPARRRRSTEPGALRKSSTYRKEVLCHGRDSDKLIQNTFAVNLAIVPQS
ncbi:hypothetical protein HZH68_014719 [Vespula germanica]|uniref:Uncharacterized protein n=1 Tax=Vespula germanica TaxID=30212 RepID=A0A834J9J4_VESGE|nr:hypothetical protein HZH68_014719 [Vespula germanica]